MLKNEPTLFSSKFPSERASVNGGVEELNNPLALVLKIKPSLERFQVVCALRMSESRRNSRSHGESVFCVRFFFVKPWVLSLRTRVKTPFTAVVDCAETYISV